MGMYHGTMLEENESSVECLSVIWEFRESIVRSKLFDSGHERKVIVIFARSNYKLIFLILCAYRAECAQTQHCSVSAANMSHR